MKILKYKIAIVVSFVIAVMSHSANVYGVDVVFNGGNLKTIGVDAEKNTGLDKIYVAYDVTGMTITYNTSSGNVPKWYKYSNLGGGYAEEISNGIIYESGSSTLQSIEGDMGYIIEDGTDRYYFWVVNYLSHRLMIDGVSVSDEQECGMTELILSGSGSPIEYYTITGQRKILNQQIEIIYSTLEWNSEGKIYEQVETSYVLESFDTSVTMTTAPLCNTTFLVRGDRFLKQWNWIQETESELYRASSVESQTEAVELESDNEKSNQINSGDEGSLGGSAPAEITFYAYTTDAVVHHEWQMARDENFEDIINRFNEQDLTYIFMEEGVYYLRYIGSNYDGSCESYGDVYTVTIGASELKCPNAFSPGVSEGINDEWKVSYKSIVEFECWIFNRNGVEMCHFTDIESGWDGKYKGRLVKPGVYYYVIKAVGADGVEYNLSGDINILRFNGGGTQQPEGDDDAVITE